MTQQNQTNNNEFTYNDTIFTYKKYQKDLQTCYTVTKSNNGIPWPDNETLINLCHNNKPHNGGEVLINNNKAMVIVYIL